MIIDGIEILLFGVCPEDAEEMMIEDIEDEDDDLCAEVIEDIAPHMKGMMTFGRNSHDTHL